MKAQPPAQTVVYLSFITAAQLFGVCLTAEKTEGNHIGIVPCLRVLHEH